MSTGNTIQYWFTYNKGSVTIIDRPGCLVVTGEMKGSIVFGEE
ncbi:hypothetical protein [Paenibacillus hexagrammi]